MTSLILSESSIELARRVAAVLPDPLDGYEASPIDCQHCGAGVGRPCRDGSSYRRRIHTARAQGEGLPMCEGSCGQTVRECACPDEPLPKRGRDPKWRRRRA